MSASPLDELAVQGNRALEGTVAGRMLSDLGRSLYLPEGIVIQAAEARKLAHRYNATIGMATSHGEPIFLPSVRRYISELSPTEIFAYAPAPGVDELRRLWKGEMGRKNPDLDTGEMGLPVVVPGLTHALSTTADLFLEKGDPVIIPELYWENYRLIFTIRRQARLLTYPLLNRGGGWNLDAIDRLLQREADYGKAALLFNFPNNPIGYSPSEREVDRLAELLQRHCARGMDILAITDDAYFGLLYEEGLYRQSLFTPLSALGSQLLAVKVDGPTKEDLAWGFRIGFLTFASPGLTPEQYAVLENKVTGGIRSLVSNSSRLAQSLLIRALKGPSYRDEKEQTFRILKERYSEAKRILAKTSLPPGVRVLPFNSGYFMTIELEKSSSEALRKRLLRDHGIGTIAAGGRYLRIAFSSVDAEDLEGFFRILFQTISEIGD